MPKQWVSSGSGFEEKIGYSRAVVNGDYVFVSGTTGYDYASMTIAEDVVSQAEQCMRNIAEAGWRQGRASGTVDRTYPVLIA